MKVFSCQVCGQILYFENTRCKSCGHQLGYLPDKVVLSALKPKGVVWTALANPALDYRRCQNHEFDTCNWLLPAQGKETLCAACRHNRTIPDLSEPENLELWRKMEFAKHRLIYTLLELGLPLINQVDAPKSRLAFEFLRESKTPHGQRVSTGHDNGTITVALDEADDAKREQVRTQMGEPYRTLLGHFRHEVGHYFWNILVRDGGRLETFRDVFGREDIDYSGALQLHYSNGPPADWQCDFVSAYA